MMIRAVALCLCLASPLFAAERGVPAGDGLAAAIAGAEPGDVLILAPGLHRGPVVIDKPLTLDGQGKARIDAGGQGSVITVGTNGKTSTNNLLADAFEAAGCTIICNRTGANLAAGITSALLQQPAAQWGVFECDELWLAHVLPRLRSNYVLLLNLFRDQLDRCGEIDRIQTSITRCGDDLAFFLMIDRNLSCNSIDLFEMTLVNMKYRFCINVVIRENLIY